MEQQTLEAGKSDQIFINLANLAGAPGIEWRQRWYCNRSTACC